jgi:hypothetical protein
MPGPWTPGPGGPWDAVQVRRSVDAAGPVVTVDARNRGCRRSQAVTLEECVFQGAAALGVRPLGAKPSGRNVSVHGWTGSMLPA